MNKSDFSKLSAKIIDGTASDEEIRLYNGYYNSFQKTSDVWNEELLGNREEIGKELSARIWTENQAGRVRSRFNWARISAAASIILCLCLGSYFLLNKSQVNRTAKNSKTDIAPGSLGATLTLANGKKIKLANSTRGELATESGVTIMKTSDGELVYEVNNTVDTAVDKINTLSTTNGQTYRVRLPDKTEVWLNAASILKYPASFTNVKERMVEVEGEAYFKVAKDKQHPFIVKVNNQQIRVLGTQFNLKGYANEPIKTTLVEGSLKVSNSLASAMLKPGQQSTLLKEGNFIVRPSDELLDLAWKNNEFMFESESIESVMKMVERWYNVEVVYVGAKSMEKFSGVVSRFDNVSKVLELLESTGSVKFKIDNRKIFVISVTNR